MTLSEDRLGELGPEVRALIEEARRHEADGHRQPARDAYQRALEALTAEDGADMASALMRWIGRTLLDDGDLDAAEDCYDAARASAECALSLVGIAHAVNAQAMVHHLRGDLDRAAELYEWAGKRAQLVEDHRLEAMIQQNLGAIANVRGRLPKALQYYRKALDLYRALDLTSYLGPLRTNIGRLQTDLRMWDAAEQSLAAALEECERSSQVSYQILVHANLARLGLARGETEVAAQECDAAFELSTRTGDHRWIGEIHKVYGILARDAGKTRLALNHLLQARETATARSDKVLSAEVSAELGVLYRRRGNGREALLHLTNAHRVFRELEASRELDSLAGRLRRFEDTFLDVVSEWGESIDRKDQYTQGHCTRVAEFACALADADGLEPDFRVWFRMGALLHDVGKVAVPDEILNKPGPLTAEEWIVMKGHPTVGVELVSDIDFPWDIKPMVLHHHERWDGTGYPHNLKGGEIPRPAQILALADVFDALTTARPYRNAMSVQKALSIIEEESGTSFNPELAELFCRIIRADESLWPTAAAERSEQLQTA